jgi:radical SAM protein with 4Fe4S-binding SPASM domain
MREKLVNALPLSLPFLVQIFPVYACNFRCPYCVHAVDKEKRNYISDEIFMDMSLYEKSVRDLADMTGKYGMRLKMLRFAAWGEPLLHRSIADMVKLAAEARIADSVEIVTNGSLLTNELSDALISARLNRLRISLEGLSSEDYRNNCSAVVDFERMVDGLRYFYERRGKCRIYIKIIDYMLKSQTDEEFFYNTFKPICDEIAVECLYDAVQGMDYQGFSGKAKFDKGQNAQKIAKISVCPQPFYMLQINPDGNIIPCCAPEYPEILGDINAQSLDDIWNGAKFDNFRLAMLDGANKVNPVCADCKTYIYDAFPEDNLDSDAGRLKTNYERRIQKWPR